ncbi:MAG: RNA methyltransferase [Flavobacteriaceae bacterium]|nr:RNA methyltransferase [Flavobacteriaceae bacterium]
MRKLRNEELNRLDVESFKVHRKTPLIVILDNIRSLHNIGAVFRTADAFLIEKVYLCGITACPPNKEIRKTALGATESVSWTYEKDTQNLVRRLQEDGVQTVAIEQAERATLLGNFEAVPQQKYAVVFGNEVKGVQQAVVDVCDQVIEIPQFGTKHSLNISVSAGIVLWEFFQKLRA